MKHRLIPNTIAGNTRGSLFWMEDEDLLSAKDWIKKTGETQFVGAYLHTYRPELGPNETDTQEELEQSILCGSTILSNGTIDRRAGIRSRTARKWLNRLGYKWKEYKSVYF